MGRNHSHQFIQPYFYCRAIHKQHHGEQALFMLDHKSSYVYIIRTDVLQIFHNGRKVPCTTTSHSSYTVHTYSHTYCLYTHLPTVAYTHCNQISQSSNAHSSLYCRAVHYTIEECPPSSPKFIQLIQNKYPIFTACILLQT